MRRKLDRDPISFDPYTNQSSRHRTQVEPASFGFGNTVVATFQTGRFNAGGGTSNIGWATTTNAGRTWTTGMLPGTTVFADLAGPWARISDPAGTQPRKVAGPGQPDLDRQHEPERDGRRLHVDVVRRRQLRVPGLRRRQGEDRAPRSTSAYTARGSTSRSNPGRSSARDTNRVRFSNHSMVPDLELPPVPN